MYLSDLSDEELQQFVKRVSEWVSKNKKDKIASELERRRSRALHLIEKAGIEKKAREEPKTTRRKRRKELEREWRKQGCVKDFLGNWKIPYELTWRSLPRGEDR